MVNDFFLRRTVNVAVLVLVVVVLLVSGTVANAAEPKLDDDWHFTLIPYLWLPSVNGKMNISLPHGSGSNDFNMSSSNYLDNLSFAAMLTMQLEKGNWSFLTDIMYVDFSDSNRQVTFPNLPGGRVDINADTGFKAWVVEAAPAYSLYRSQSVK